MIDKIDFVIPWVDGSDPAWREEKIKVQGNVESDDREIRYRDWNNLQYWFRGVEKYAPWVNKIFFITYGHLPVWLNTGNPKLKIVNHKDFMPEQYLPTFNVNPIELNMHRIKDLSEHFVYFNDDMFLIDSLCKEDFFVDGKPCDSGVMTIHCYNLEVFIMSHIRDVGYVNKYYNIKNVIREKPHNWFNFKYGKYNLRNLLLYFICPRFPGFYMQHLPSSFLKSTISDLWSKEYEVLNETCLHKIRCIQDINQWIFKDMQLASNNFVPRNINIGKSFSLLDIDEIIKYTKNRTGKMICINDNPMSEKDFIRISGEINQMFDEILPEKSSYEI